jgi:hypothetical protein
MSGGIGALPVHHFMARMTSYGHYKRRLCLLKGKRYMMQLSAWQELKKLEIFSSTITISL